MKTYSFKTTRNIFLFFGLVFTSLIIFSLLLNINHKTEETEKFVESLAKNTFQKDITYRKWVTMHGGVYAPKTEYTPSNKYLDVDERDITTPSGKELTLINPAYMTRQVHQLFDSLYNIKGHLTSLNPINPDSKADEWETRALNLFEQGIEEFSGFETTNGIESFRYMRAMITEEGCLKCHERQGYKLGDIRGGLSVTIPMEEFNATNREHSLHFVYAHFSIWISVIALGVFLFFKMKKDSEAGLTRENLLVETQKIAKLGHYQFDLIENKWESSELLDKIFGVDEKFQKTLENWSLIVHPEDREMMVDYFVNHVVKEKIKFDKEYRIISINDKKEKWVHGLGELEINEAGEVVKMIGTISDISARKQVEQELDAYRQRLEEKVADRTKELSSLNYKLQEEIVNRERAESIVKVALQKEKDLNKLKTEFISTASHEFKTPLTTIMASADLLEMNLNSSNTQQRQKYINNIISAVEDMNILMDDVLIVSRMERGKMDFQPVDTDLKEFIESIIEQMSTLKKDGQSIELIYNVAQKYCRVDQKLFKHIFTNLITNAIKYTNDSGQIICRVSVEDENLLVVVEDNGPGIPREELQQIFEAFHRSKASINQPGTGLGLFIVKNSVKLHNGTIDVVSDINSGTRFTIKIPLNC